MNLPIFNELISNQSNYILFSRALNDYDYAIANNTPFYLTKMVAIDFPPYRVGDFYVDMNEIFNTTNPNLAISKAFQYYTENIIRQNVNVPEITEIAFWKTLNKFGVDAQTIKNSVVFINDLVNATFFATDNNNGWAEIVGIIPNKCQKLTPAWSEVASLPNVNNYTGDYLNDISYFDDFNNKTFDFTTFRDKIDFNNLVFEDIDNEFKFNVLLLFYRDKDNVEKLHGVNFINPFKNVTTHYEFPSYIQRTNDYKSIGYQFKFNIKTVNNEATQQIIESVNLDTTTFWDSFNEQLSLLNQIANRFQ